MIVDFMGFVALIHSDPAKAGRMGVRMWILCVDKWISLWITQVGRGLAPPDALNSLCVLLAAGVANISLISI